MKVFVYDTSSGNLEVFSRALGDQMPYIRNKYLSVREFRGKSKSEVIWTTKQTMEAFNKTREKWGQNIYVGYAFRRIFEGGHGDQSQHYSGTALDVAQNLSVSERKKLYQLAVKLNVWKYVEPINLTPTWLHFDLRYGTPACSAGYPTFGYDSRGVYVLILQDALSTAGYSTVSLDGIFQNNTQNALGRYQNSEGLTVNYITDCSTWQTLTKAVKGNGKTATTLDY